MADSLAAISDFARCIAAYGEQLMHASVLMNGRRRWQRRHVNDETVASE
ncbi:hypothetical protein [Bradyrhizobium sp. dw_411]|nr:hypothetical protein [Bradyrhizobium sp. dw_411]